MGKKFSEINLENCSEEEVEKIAKEKNINIDNIKDSINKYNGLNYDELLNEFIKLNKQKKINGETNYEEIENLKNNLYPMLNDEQKQKFNELIKYMM